MAARNPLVRCGEAESYFPIAENIAEVGGGDLVISDFHTPEKAARLLREVCGLHNALHVSHDDKATGKIWKQLANSGTTPSLHLGDDLTTDFGSPRAHGVNAKLTTVAQMNDWERELYELGLRNLAFIIREARLATWDARPEMRMLQLFQIQANFPFLYVASLYFHEALRAKDSRREYSKFVMSSRDCFLWKKIMDRISDGYEVVYWHTSRVTRYKPSKSYMQYCGTVFVGPTMTTDLCGFGKSLLCFFDGWLTNTIWLLVGYGDFSCCAINGWLDESSNLARHPMVIDVVDGKPVFWQDGIDWEANPHINCMHEAFDRCIAAMDGYDFPRPDNLDALLKRTFENFSEMSLPALGPLTEFRREESIRAAKLLEGIEGVVI